MLWVLVRIALIDKRDRHNFSVASPARVSIPLMNSSLTEEAITFCHGDLSWNCIKVPTEDFILTSSIARISNLSLSITVINNWNSEQALYNIAYETYSLSLTAVIWFYFPMSKFLSKNDLLWRLKAYQILSYH